jgi:hypothetical protein
VYVPHEPTCMELPLIHRYMRQNKSWAETCPVCQGRPW